VYSSEVLTVCLGISHAFSIQKRLQNIGLCVFMNLLELEFVEVYVYEFGSLCRHILLSTTYSPPAMSVVTLLTTFDISF
jgi:hypothetical protein